jgi:type II secretory pathway pseudopilin PulG
MSVSPAYLNASDEGFTISELLVSVGLLVIIIGSAFMALTAVSSMTESVYASAQANNTGSNAIEWVAKDVRRAWNPKDGPRWAFRARTANQAVFYVGGSDNGKVSLITYNVAADGAGTYTLSRTEGVTATAVKASDVVSTTQFPTSSTRVIATKLTSPNVFQYFVQATNLPAATVTTPPASVQITVVNKATVGQRTSVATNTLLVQVRTLYRFTNQ